MEKQACKQKQFLDFLFILNTEQPQFLSLQIERNKEIQCGYLHAVSSQGQ